MRLVDRKTVKIILQWDEGGGIESTFTVYCWLSEEERQTLLEKVRSGEILE